MATAENTALNSDGAVAGDAASPPALMHVGTFGFVLTGVLWTAGLLGFAQWRVPLAGALGLVCVASLILDRHRSTQRVLAHSLSLLVVVAVTGLFILMEPAPTPLRLAELVLFGLVLAQTIGACRPVHYRVLGMLGLLLILAGVRRAGIIPLSVVVPAVVSGSFILLDTGAGRRQAENLRRRSSFSYIPLGALVPRFLAVVLVALIGGKIVSAHLPVLETGHGEGEQNLWINFVRHQLRKRTSDQESPVQGSVPNAEADFLRRHYASAALLDLTSTDPSSLTNRLLLTVDSDRPLYLRGMALDHYTGHGWEPSEPLRYERATRPGFTEKVIGLPNRPTHQGANLEKVQIWVQDDIGRSVYVPTQATSIMANDLPLVLKDQFWNLYSANDVGVGAKYICYVGQRDLKPLVNTPMGQDAEPVGEQYLQLPLLPDRLIRRCNGAGEGKKGRMAVVQTLIGMIREDKGYTEAPQEIPAEVDAVDHFVFEMQEGSCSHFASALAVACRIVGIPARVVTGFGPGKYDSSSMNWRIRGKDSHAWTQVWFPEYGWANFDPTPARFADARKSTAKERSSVTETISSWKRQLIAAWERLKKIGKNVLMGAQAHWIWSIYALGGAVAAVPLLLILRYGGRRLVWWIRWIRAPHYGPREAGAMIYRCCLEWMRRRGFEVERTMTPTEIVESVQDEGYAWSAEFAEFSRLAERLVFGGAGSGQNEVQRLRKRARDLRSKLGGDKEPEGNPPTI